MHTDKEIMCPVKEITHSVTKTVQKDHRKILQSRAKLFSDIREFFNVRSVLEVETPLLSQGVATDPHILALETFVSGTHSTLLKNSSKQKFYLQTSPEFAMKRLLAEGSGPIFQICKAFRDEEKGKFHNPEFTILEWYRPGFNHFQLMDEVDDFLIKILGTKKATRISYQALFLQYCHIDPHRATLDELWSTLEKMGIEYSLQNPTDIEYSPSQQNNLDRDDLLNLLVSHCIEPHLGFDAPCMIYDYPETQAALAKIRMGDGNVKVAERFEVYVQGIELANGYHELTDAKCQLSRFQQDIALRKKLNKTDVPIDHRLIQALEKGMPECAGIALGLDRLLMLQQKCHSIQEILSFPIDEA